MSALRQAVEPPVSAATEQVVADAIARACGRVAPLWPLEHFVAVNPFLGFTDHSFAATCATFRRVSGVELLMPREFYRELLTQGRIDDEDVRTALRALTHADGLPADVAALTRALDSAPRRPERPKRVVATVADVLDALAARDRQLSRTAFMVDEISKWCAAYFDAGQAPWPLPTRSLPPYAAWRATARHDRTPETLGIRGFRATIEALPPDPVATITRVVQALGIPAAAIEDYLHRALFDIRGWAAFARQRAWGNAHAGQADDTLVGLLAIRIAWGYGLFLERTDPPFRKAWAAAMADAAALPPPSRVEDDPDLRLDLLLQGAWEAAYQRGLIAQLAAAGGTPRSRSSSQRIPLQAAFCIDVRSEVYRRALEHAYPEAETLGFAGFFGFPIEFVPIGDATGRAQCPVLLTPSFVVCEAVAGASEETEAAILRLRRIRRRAARAWNAFKLSAVSSFTYVETAGLLFAAKLIGDSLGLRRTVRHPDADGLPRSARDRLAPRLAPRVVAERVTGIDAAQRLALAEAALRAMSLTGEFARLVLLVGHGSTSTNNPHAAALDCGACGGHTGEANARVAASVLNDPAVRSGLAARGISIPADTWFLGALHDTTTDAVEIFDLAALPDSHRQDLTRLRHALARASALARQERAAHLGISARGNPDAEVIARSRDWSQVRPEWGLAGNAAFIAAPRALTRDLDLGGRAFLHDYDWREDTRFGVLELIMTAPLVVASWINLQYYGSTVNNRAFGSGNKTLHNVVGRLGVLEGNGGDLKTGLPWQSVHDGERLVHEPLRLSVFIEAPEAEINRVIARHPGVRDLVDNGWVHLFALADHGRTVRRYVGGQRWKNAQ